jgi:hypothetical protein
VIPILVLIALEATAVAPRQTPAETGRTLFTERCAVCHGVNGTGGTLAQSMIESFILHPSSEILNPESSIPNSESLNPGSRIAIRDSGFGIRDSGFGIRDRRIKDEG